MLAWLDFVQGGRGRAKSLSWLGKASSRDVTRTSWTVVDFATKQTYAQSMNLTLKNDVYPNLDSIFVIEPATVEVTTKGGGRFRIQAGEYKRGGDVDRYHAIYDELVKHRHGDVEDPAFGPHEVWTKTNMADAKGGTIEECIERALAFVNNLELGRNTGPHKR